MDVLEALKKRGFEVVEDEGLIVDTGNERIRVRCKYLVIKNGKKVACIDETTPNAILPAEKLLKSYARIVGARYALLIAGDKLAVYDVVGNREVSVEDIKEAEGVKARDSDFRIVAAYYPLIHCSCEVERCES